MKLKLYLNENEIVCVAGLMDRYVFEAGGMKSVQTTSRYGDSHL